LIIMCIRRGGPASTSCAWNCHTAKHCDHDSQPNTAADTAMKAAAVKAATENTRQWPPATSATGTSSPSCGLMISKPKHTPASTLSSTTDEAVASSTKSRSHGCSSASAGNSRPIGSVASARASSNAWAPNHRPAAISNENSANGDNSSSMTGGCKNGNGASV